MKRLAILWIMLLTVATGVRADRDDSAQMVIDSLRQQLREMELRELDMRHVLDSTGQTARTDSIRRERRRQHIDSLRHVTPGEPLVVEGDTLFFIYAPMGGESPRQRVEKITNIVYQIGKSLRTTTDSVKVFESEFATDLMCGEIVIMHVSDLDGLWNGKSRQQLAGDFVAALFSLGSTASIGNLISGIIITYMRPFLVGDFVQIGDREGTVIEKNTFVTRLRDIKDNIITVPNNSILSLPTVNYSAAVRLSGGTIVHSDFTFTYKVYRQQIEPLLLEAAGRCQLLLKTPPPFVLITALDDFYTRYQINAYTQEAQRLPDVYTELHRNILDVFRENNLEPTSSHFVKLS